MSKAAGKGESVAGRIWIGTMGLALSALGAGFCVYLWKSYMKAESMDEWVARSCVVAAAAVEEAGKDRFGAPRYRVAVRYGYSFEGAGYFSERVKRLEIAGSRSEELRKWVDRFPAGSEQTCYVDPSDPATAVLVKDSKAALYSLWFPMLFVVGGLGIAAGAWRGGKGRGEKTACRTQTGFPSP